MLVVPWSPIGDVTTTMLWIGDKVSTGNLFIYLFIPSVLCMVVPTFIASFLPPFKGDLELVESGDKPINKYSSTMLFLGLGAIVFVPIFKVVTHLPPYVGMNAFVRGLLPHLQRFIQAHVSRCRR
jgi:Na+/H+ antiporter NhaD/arsenite permease-like protein